MISHSKALTLVKSTQTIISEFVGSTLDPCYTKGKIDTYPTVLKTGNSFFIDYSNSTNVSDLKFLKHFFDGLTSGNTFSISGGTYFISETGLQYSFNGQFKLENKLGDYNNYIYLQGITYPAALFDGVYDNQNFIGPLFFAANSGNTAQYFLSRVNKEDPFNLEFLGVYGADYGYEEFIELSGACSNSGRYKIKNYVKLNDGSEVVYIEPSESIVSEKMYFRNNNVNIYMRGVPDLVTLSQNKNTNGIIKKITKEGNVLQILGNQNLHQKYCRNVADLDNYYDWYAATKLSNMQNIYNPSAYDGLSISINSFSFIKVGIKNEYSDPDLVTGLVSLQTIPILIVDGVETTIASFNLRTYVSDPVIKLDLSDASLVGWKIIPYLDYELSLPLDDYYFLNGVPGYDGASFIYFKRVDSPATIFLKFEQNIVLKLTLQM